MKLKIEKLNIFEHILKLKKKKRKKEVREK